MIKIILTGPESTGKTTLAKQLAEHFNAPLVEEYARTFFEKKGIPQYLQEDLVEIAKGHLMYDEQCMMYAKQPDLIICDTDLLTLKIWSNEVFGNCSPDLAQLIENQLNTQYAIRNTQYFLCSPEGIEWEADPLRENPQDRDRLFKIYETELKFYKKKYFILRGDKKGRFDKAKKKIEQLLQNRV